VRIYKYDKEAKEFIISVGMKYDTDAINILKKIKTIYLHDKNDQL
jgi:hypothetical protein